MISHLNWVGPVISTIKNLFPLVCYVLGFVRFGSLVLEKNLKKNVIQTDILVSEQTDRQTNDGQAKNVKSLQIEISLKPSHRIYCISGAKVF